MPIKVATWNLCLGLQNKKDLVLNELDLNNIDVCGLQETEIGKDYPIDILGNNKYEFEAELNDTKKRVGMYISKKLNYKRRFDLEKMNCHLIIVDLTLDSDIRIINLYRSFRPPDNLSPSVFFSNQLEIIRTSINQNTILMGDFNLDAEMQYRIDYPHNRLYNMLNDIIEQFNLIQLVDFPTWSRTINNIYKQSTLDHVYITNSSNVLDCYSFPPPFGDHKPVITEINFNSKQTTNEIRRDWRFYSSIKCEALFADVDFNIDCVDVQAYWNCFENLVINRVDKIAPLVLFNNDRAPPTKPPLAIHSKINKRKRLIKKQKVNRDPDNYHKIKVLDNEIKKKILK
jgi:hypothetical protein